MELLRPLAGRGYPEEYLNARLRGRRAFFVDDWQAIAAAENPLELLPETPRRGRLTAASEGIVWDGLLREFAWIYRQMDGRFRKMFSPLFGWFELRTVIIALRNRQGAGSQTDGDLLRFSLLADEVKRALSGEGEHPQIVARVAVILEKIMEQRGRLLKGYEAGGAGEFERILSILYLERVMDSKPHPLMAGFFSYLIDLENLMGLYKALRWQVGHLSPFVRGGSISPEQLAKVRGRNDMAQVIILAKRLAETKGRDEMVPLEPLLLRGLGRKLHKLGKEPGGPAPLLDYLWRCYAEARNLSLIIHCGASDRQQMATELIQ